jgi:hypothetical protein
MNTALTGQGEWDHNAMKRWRWEERISPVLHGVPATAIDGEVHNGSDGALH